MDGRRLTGEPMCAGILPRTRLHVQTSPDNPQSINEAVGNSLISGDFYATKRPFLKIVFDDCLNGGRATIGQPTGDSIP